MDMSVAFQDKRFCVVTQAFFFELLDTPENRQVAVVFLRCLRDGEGRPLFTLRQVAQIVGSPNRQAAGCHVDTFWAGGVRTLHPPLRILLDTATNPLYNSKYV